jgi:zinc/manganese transport system substrate-binding protein
MREIARAAGIPLVAATETAPAGENYQSWMMSELDAVERALAKQAP